MSLNDLSDNDRVEVPFFENIDDLFFAAFARNDQHPLLRFGQKHFVSGHSSLTLRNERKV